jgi:hypothetical protein
MSRLRGTLPRREHVDNRGGKGMKTKVIYQEKYRKPYPTIRESLLPDTLPYFTEGSMLVRIEVLTAGKVQDQQGCVLEFQDIRVFTKQKEPPK